MKLSDLPSVKLPRRGNLSYKQFLRYVEENYFQSKNLALWMLYKGAHKSRDMTEVCPCAPSVLRPSDYYQGRNVVWQWVRGGALRSSVLLQAAFSAELEFIVERCACPLLLTPRVNHPSVPLLCTPWPPQMARYCDGGF